MKRRIVLLTLVMFVASLFCGIGREVYAKEYKLGYVDLAKVFDEYKKTKESEKTFATKRKAKEAERKAMVDEVKKLKDELALLSEKAKTEKQSVIDQKIKNLQEMNFYNLPEVQVIPKVLEMELSLCLTLPFIIDIVNSEAEDTK